MIDPTVRVATGADAIQLLELETDARAALVDQRGGARWLVEHPEVGARWPDLVDDPAVDVLAAVIDHVVVGYIVAVLGDDSEYIRRYAVVALGEIGGAAQKAIPEIRKLADDEDEDVREAVKKALKQIQMPG